MASVEDLKEALRENLDRSGKLRQLKAQLRADVYTALNPEEATAPQLSNENLLINELIREYLVYNNYRASASVFLPETGQPAVRPFDRAFLASHLNVPEGQNSTQLPLLYSLVEIAAKAGRSSQQTTIKDV